MRNILVIFYLLSFASLADMVPPDVELSPEKAFCLGFTLDRPTDEYVGLQYPRIIDQKWEPVTTVVEYGLNGTPVFIIRNDFDEANEEPTIMLGFHESINSGGDAAVFITYQCTKECGVTSFKRYVIPSIVKYTQSNVQECL